MRGGKRKGAGRPPGAKNTRKADAEKVIAQIAANIPDAFQGDSHDFFVSVYCNPEYDLHSRLYAAGKAIPYEKPRLSTITLAGDEKRPIAIAWMESSESIIDLDPNSPDSTPGASGLPASSPIDEPEKP